MTSHRPFIAEQLIFGIDGVLPIEKHQSTNGAILIVSSVRYGKSVV